jgi:hypothetical protein
VSATGVKAKAKATVTAEQLVEAAKAWVLTLHTNKATSVAFLLIILIKS